MTNRTPVWQRSRGFGRINSDSRGAKLFGRGGSHRGQASLEAAGQEPILVSEGGTDPISPYCSICSSAEIDLARLGFLPSRFGRLTCRNVYLYRT
jgi:hypothetical protein